MLGLILVSAVSQKKKKPTVLSSNDLQTMTGIYHVKKYYFLYNIDMSLID
jgi:hypothetical protein